MLQIVDDRLLNLCDEYYSLCDDTKEVCKELARIVDVIGFRESELEKAQALKISAAKETILIYTLSKIQPQIRNLLGDMIPPS